jgi:hypothetical protein
VSKDFEAQLSAIVETKVKNEEATKARGEEKAKIEQRFDNEWNHVRDSVVEPLLKKAVEALGLGSMQASISKPPVRKPSEGGRGETRVVPGTTGIELQVPGGGSRRPEELVLRFEPSWKQGQVTVKHHHTEEDLKLSEITAEYVEGRILAFLNEAVLNRKP